MKFHRILCKTETFHLHNTKQIEQVPDSGLVAIIFQFAIEIRSKTKQINGNFTYACSL